MATIRNPIEWTAASVRLAAAAVASTGHGLGDERAGPTLPVRRIAFGDLRTALRHGLDDFAHFRTDVVFLCLVYPVVGLVLGRLAFREDMVPLLFPIASGFALVGPFAAVGLYEMSRRREAGLPVSWPKDFAASRSPAFGKIAALGLIHVLMLLLWLAAAQLLYDATFGPEPPASLGAFARAVLTTETGWILIVAGCGVGFLFAAAVLAMSVVSFPLLIDRDVSAVTAISTSVRAAAANVGMMALWGLIVAVALALGSIPFLLGLVIVMPVLGHATWHLYRALVPRPLSSD
jgi:uncharacterized membrane protein